MSYDVMLERDGRAVMVPKHTFGGAYHKDGTTLADTTVTYNFSSWFYKTLCSVAGLRCLDGRKAASCTAALRKAVRVLRNRPSKDPWKPTKGNAGAALAMLLAWADEHPEATFRVV